MNIALKRKWFTDISTIGKLYIDDEFFCYTLEDVVRPVGEKVFGKTAIPWGSYDVIISYSNRFKKSLPLLLDVPNFTGIRMHSGNVAENTEGCILVGLSHQVDSIGESRAAMAKVLSRLQIADINKEVIRLTISAEATI